MKKLSLFSVFVIITFFLFFSISGCAIFKNSHKTQKSAEQLAGEGVAAFRADEFQNAIAAFKKLKDWYPFSKYASLAQLKIADAHYKLKEYDEALSAYHEFETMHPKNDAVPYVIYRMGMCWYDRLDSVDREQDFTKKALEQFKRLTKTFPDSAYAFKAERKIKKCIENLAGHELYVANFYFKSKHYKAALNRFEYIFAHYPDTYEGKEAMSMISKCQRLMEGSGKTTHKKGFHFFNFLYN